MTSVLRRRGAIDRVVEWAMLASIRVYQRTLSPALVFLFGRGCRFEPSCSRYAAQCVEAHGPWRGALLSAVRLCKCQPFHPGGFDPPPPRLEPAQNPASPS